MTAAHAHGWTETYAYDAAGNLTHATAPAHEASGDREFTGTVIHRAGRTTYEHGTQSRLTRRTRKLLNGQTRTWTYIWNTEDRLTHATTPDGEHWHYMYDPLGRRISKQRLAEDGTVTEAVDFTWDGTQPGRTTHARGRDNNLGLRPRSPPPDKLMSYDDRRLDATREVGATVAIERVDPNAVHPDSTTGRTWAEQPRRRMNSARTRNELGEPVPSTGVEQRPDHARNKKYMRGQ